MDGRQLLANYIQGRTTQAQFAREVRCSEPHLSLVLTGKRGVSLKLAKRIKEATGGAVPIESLVAEEAAQ